MVVPDGQRWLFTRTVALFRILRNGPAVALEPQSSRSVTRTDDSSRR